MRSKSVVDKLDECFNRYMVECESDKSPFAIASVTSFNRYMVECE